MGQFSFHRRPHFLKRLKEEYFEVLIVGGGVNGVGVFRDLCLRSSPSNRRRFALIEKDHFATSASSKNSQLIHGGLRYLKYLDLSLVREALHERARLLRIAPHAVWTQSFLLPVYQLGKRCYYQMGVTLYEWLSGSEKLGKCAWLNAQKALEQEPNLNPNGLRGAMLFWDGRMHASRLILDQLRETVEWGALAVNFVEARETIQQSGQVSGMHARDQLTGEEFPIRAGVIVNTVGPWERTTPIRLVRGSHLVFPQLTKGSHALAFFEEQGRILFVIPYGPERRFSLVGTTEMAQDNPEPVQMDPGERHYLCKHLREILPTSNSREPRGHYSALRPLIPGTPTRSLSAISRGHRIWKSAPNVYHLGGGKWTTFRLMAEELVDFLAREHYPHLESCKTSEEPIDGNTEEALNELRKRARELCQEYKVSLKTVNLLLDNYGRRTLEVLSLCREAEWRRPLVPNQYTEDLPYIHAQMRWAVENEMTGRLKDFLRISTPLEYLHRFPPETRKELQKYFELE